MGIQGEPVVYSSVGILQEKCDNFYRTNELSSFEASVLECSEQV